MILHIVYNKNVNNIQIKFEQFIQDCKQTIKVLSYKVKRRGNMSVFNSDADVNAIWRIIKTRGAKIHFIGILGSGMLPLANMLCAMGCEVTGSDMNYDSRERISRLDGISVTPHRRINVWGKDMVVYSLAIDDFNPELISARALAIPLISRAQLLGALMLPYPVRIGVSGSHGKSTTVAVLDSILTTASSALTTISGATLLDGASYRHCGNDIMLYEACEYKDSFLRMFPTHQIITGIELDHTDYFSDINDIYSSFERCAHSAGTVVVNVDCPVASRLVDGLKGEVVTYGKREGADYRFTREGITDGRQRFTVHTPDGDNIRLTTSLIGEFNLYNITAAVAMSHKLSIDKKSIILGVCNFRTITRRMSPLGRLCGREVFYDYAHHPTEISNVIDAVREEYGECTVVFRPHTFTRTQTLWDEFVSVLCKAKFAILLDIYSAREKSISGITSARLAECIGDGAVRLDFDEVVSYLEVHTSGPIILMGAGDIEPVIKDLFMSEHFDSSSK